MATTPRHFGDGDGGDDMNASLWGELQSFIDLSMIYAKLPLVPFFRLRQVCKEWNRLASDRQFLEQNFKPPISSNPYFILTRPSEGPVMWAFEDSSCSSTLLTSEGSSWSSTCVPRARCEVSGLLFEDSDRNRVFDLHTRVFHTLPPLPPTLPAVAEAIALRIEEEGVYEDPVLLMTVDTTQTPYGFRVIIADEIMGLRIYDSNNNAWTHKPSTYEYCGPAFGTSCMHRNNSLYMRVGRYTDRWYNVLTYDLEKDVWDFKCLGTVQDVWGYIDIGMWQDWCFVFAVTTWREDGDDDDESLLNVWESPLDFEKPWVDFDSMPKDLCKWMRGSDYLYTLNKFCGEHVLFYNCMEDEERAVLYSFDKKTWDKIEFPTTSMVPKRARLSEDL